MSELTVHTVFKTSHQGRRQGRDEQRSEEEGSCICGSCKKQFIFDVRHNLRIIERMPTLINLPTDGDVLDVAVGVDTVGDGESERKKRKECGDHDV